MVADAIGVAHFVIANLIVLLGYVSNAFNSVVPQEASNKGLYFIYLYLDRPVFLIFQGFVASTKDSPWLSFLAGELVIVVSTILYGFIAYFSIRIYLSLND